MRNVFYLTIPAAAFSLVLLNALFGHLLFESDAEQVANKYSIYVHLQPEWKSHPRNIIFDVTNSWFRQGAQEDGGPTYNANRLLYVDGKPFVELRHDFSECRGEWTPILYRRVIDAVRHEIEYVQGSQLSADPSISIYPDVANPGYGQAAQEQKTREGFAQFIPICTSAANTTYDYSIKTDGEGIGMDVYFVPSEQGRDDYYTQDFEHYAGPGCTAKNKHSFSGQCSGLAAGSGLLVVIPDELKAGVTKITVNLYEGA